MKKLTIIFALFLIALTAQISFSQELTTGASDKSMLIKTARFLEQSPFDKNAKKLRGSAFQYIAESSDVSVVVCAGDLTKAPLDKKNKYGGELLLQYTLGMAVYKIENAGKEDENAAQMAGVESMLRAYESMVREKPEAKFAGMDELLARRDKGELEALVKAADCGKKESK
jgi:hypothetical protein